MDICTHIYNDAQSRKFSDSTERLQLSEALTQFSKEFGFLESPGDWSYWSMTLYVVITPKCQKIEVCHVDCPLNCCETPTHIYHSEITLSLTILHLDLTLRVTVHLVSTAPWETKVSTVGLVGTCHINGVALEPTAAEKYELGAAE